MIDNKSVESVLICVSKNARLKARGERVMSKVGPKFKELRVWQKGKDLAVYIYQSKLISARSKTSRP